MRRFWKGILLLALVCCLTLQARAADLAVERKVYDYLTGEMGLPSAAACGVLANIENESGFQVNVLGDNGTSYGLCQWHADRYNHLKTYCMSQGMDYRTVEGQLAYLNYELRTNYSSLLLALRMMEDDPNGAYRAAYLWCVQFERPANMEEKAVNRGVLAKGKYWNRYNSLVMVVQQVQPAPTVAEVKKEIQEKKLTIPEPPHSGTVERYYEEDTEPVLPLSPYIPKHRPKAEWGATPALGYAAAVLFMPMIEEKKQRFALEMPKEACPSV